MQVQNIFKNPQKSVDKHLYKCYTVVTGLRNPSKPQGVERMELEMPNAAEIIERLARENERLKIEIERLKAQLAEKG